MLRQLEAVESDLDAGDESLAFDEPDRGAAAFVELGFDLPLDRLEAALRRLEQVAPENPWVLFCLAWVWSTRRRHTLAPAICDGPDSNFTPAGRPTRREDEGSGSSSTWSKE